MIDGTVAVVCFSEELGIASTVPLTVGPLSAHSVPMSKPRAAQGLHIKEGYAHQAHCKGYFVALVPSSALFVRSTKSRIIRLADATATEYAENLKAYIAPNTAVS